MELKKSKFHEIIVITVFSVLFFAITAFNSNVFDRIMSVATFLTWHSLLEFISILASFSIFIATYYIYEETGSLRMIILACGFFIMGSIDTFHTLSYKGMAEFFIANDNANRATTFWVISRLIGSISLLAAFYIPEEKRTDKNKVFFIIPTIFLVIGLLIIVTYKPEFLPAMYIEGRGLTNAKLYLEYLVVLIMVITFLKVQKNYRRTNKRLDYLIMIALLLSIFSEYAFISYGSVYDAYNYLGHIYKAVAYFFLFKAIYVESISIPYRELKKAQDELQEYSDNLNNLVRDRTEELENINEILMNDIENAKLMQRSLLPEKLPKDLSASFHAVYIPAERLSGDFYNVIKLDKDNVAIYIGDVAGHGVSAAMLTVFANQNIKPVKEGKVFEIIQPSEIMNSLYNTFNVTNYRIETYLVMLYGVYNKKTRIFTYASGGINVPPLLITSSGQIRELDVEGFPICKLGDYFTPEYKDVSIVLNPGDKILFYTDGLVDVKSKSGTKYNQNDLKDFLSKNYSMKASTISSAIKGNLFSKIGTEKIFDDVTYLILEVQ